MSRRPVGHVRETRKHVVVLFVDLVDSTVLGESLDPEALQNVLDQYFAICSERIEEHGGATEKFIGDAVMVAFGVPVTHEDDASRAALAALDIINDTAALNSRLAEEHGIRLQLRAGISSGEALVRILADGDFRIVGDVANTASRLQSAAAPGELLVSSEVARMIRSQCELEEIAPLSLRGKSAPVAAWRVRSLSRSQARPERVGQSLINRVQELEVIRQAYQRVVTYKQCCLVTILGASGIGKTRLIWEFIGTAGQEGASVVSGRCRSYGRGASYQPIAEILQSIPGGWSTLQESLDEEGIMALRSVTGDDLPVSRAFPGVEEIAHAIACVFEAIAERKPLIVVFDDMQWAEPALADLIEHVVDWLADFPVLIICVARPEFLEARPTWGGGMLSAITLEIGALNETHIAELVATYGVVADILPHELDPSRSWVIRKCEGNPLFAELMLDMLEEGEQTPEMPPTIQALIGARLDQLEVSDRGILERAAVIGRDFTLDALGMLTSEESEGDARPSAIKDSLRSLRKRRIVERGDREGEYRFTQVLIRDTVYLLTPKSSRQRWHTSMAEWLSEDSVDDARGGNSGGLIGYHLEAAYFLRRDLRPGDPAVRDLGERAARVLASDGMRALHRHDLSAAAGLLERAQALLPHGHKFHLELCLRIADAGLGLWDAERALNALAKAESAAPGDPRTRVVCEIERDILGMRMGTASLSAIAADVEQIGIALAGDQDDDLGWCRFHQLRAHLHVSDERLGDAENELRSALQRAGSAGNEYEEERILSDICQLALWGKTPVTVGVALCDELLERFAGNRVSLVPVLIARAGLTAVSGDVNGAREYLARARQYIDLLHVKRARAVLAQTSGMVESLAGSHGRAEEEYRKSAVILRQGGQVRGAQTLEALAAREVFERGYLEKSIGYLETLEREAGETDRRTQLIIRSLRGRVLSSTERHSQAIAVISSTAELALQTDDLCLRGDVQMDLAQVLCSAGDAEAAASAVQVALSLYRQKGARLLADSAEGWHRQRRLLKDHNV